MVALAWPFAPPRRQWPFPGSLSPSGAPSLWSELRHPDSSLAARLPGRPGGLSDLPPEGKVGMWEQFPSVTANSRHGLLSVEGAHGSLPVCLLSLFLSLLWLKFHEQKCSPISLPKRNIKNHAFQGFFWKNVISVSTNLAFILSCSQESANSHPHWSTCPLSTCHSQPWFSGPGKPRLKAAEATGRPDGKTSWRSSQLLSPPERH